MKTLIVNGSPRKNGDTAALIKALTQHLHGEVWEASAHYDNISPCVDCRMCWQNPGCAIDDDMQEVYRYLQDCDNVVLASPIWFSALSGPMMNMASRLQTYFAAGHFRGESSGLTPKRGVLLLAGAEPGTEKPAMATAHTVLKLMNALPCVATVTSMRTDQTPAAEDKVAMAEAKAAAELLNKLAGV